MGTAVGISTLDRFRMKYEYKGSLCLVGAITIMACAYFLSQYSFLEGVKHALIGDGSETNMPEDRNDMWWLFLTS